MFVSALSSQAKNDTLSVSLFLNTHRPCCLHTPSELVRQAGAVCQQHTAPALLIFVSCMES